MVIIKIYRLVEQGGYFYVKDSESSICPVCNKLLSKRSWRLRKFIDAAGNKTKLFIRRLFCKSCTRMHHELPDLLIPYKRHCVETIEAISSGKPVKAPCEESTIRRILTWWSVVMPYFMDILKSLAVKYQTKYQPSPAFKEMVRAAANTNNWISINSICTRSACMPR